MSSSWLPLIDALAKTAEVVTPITEKETLSLDSLLGRICAEDVVAPVNVPPWDNSAMDGYAVSENAAKMKAPLPISSKVLAGDPIGTELDDTSCVRIMTGAPVPKNTYAVVMQENTICKGNDVLLQKLPSAGENIRRKSDDIAKGSTVISSGTRITAAHIMLIASLGINEVVVYRKVKIGIMATGDELVEPGNDCSAAQIYESNRSGIKALLQKWNLDIIDYGIVADDLTATLNILKRASSECDLVISSGGVSVGDADFVKDALAELGSIDFWKVAIKPGKPFAFGTIGKTLFAGVPGNPVSAYITTEQIIYPIIRLLQSEQAQKVSESITVSATITANYKRKPGRKEFVRATAKSIDQKLMVTPMAKQSSGVMTSVANANCYLILDEQTTEVIAGDAVQIQLFSHS